MADDISVSAGVATYTARTEQLGSGGSQVPHAVISKVTGALGSRTEGSLNSHRVSTGTDTVGVNNGATTFHSIVASNKGTSTAYVKLHNTNTPTMGAGVVRTFPVEPGIPTIFATSAGGQRGPFGTGFGVSITRNLADNDTTAVGAGEIVYDLEYTTS